MQEKSDTMYIYNFQKKNWKKLVSEDPKPCARSGHSATMFLHWMYVFGGSNNANQKLNDMWRFDTTEEKWEQIVSRNGVTPCQRSGHSCDVFGDYLIVFGGFYHITKELNDLYVFSIRENNWIQIFEDTHYLEAQPAHQLHHGSRRASDTDVTDTIKNKSEQREKEASPKGRKNTSSLTKIPEEKRKKKIKIKKESKLDQHSKSTPRLTPRREAMTSRSFTKKKANIDLSRSNRINTAASMDRIKSVAPLDRIKSAAPLGRIKSEANKHPRN